MAFPVVLDADVLYGIQVCDLLLWMAEHQLFRPHWSPEILDEVQRNLAKRPELDDAKIQRRVDMMNKAQPGALAVPTKKLIKAMTNDRKDRHVLALAVQVDAQVIVTNNLRHFPEAALDPYGVEALNADQFVVAQVDLDAQRVYASVEGMASTRKRYPKTPNDIIERLATELPNGMAALRAVVSQIS